MPARRYTFEVFKGPNDPMFCCIIYCALGSFIYNPSCYSLCPAKSLSTDPAHHLPADKVAALSSRTAFHGRCKSCGLEGPVRGTYSPIIHGLTWQSIQGVLAKQYFTNPGASGKKCKPNGKVNSLENGCSSKPAE